MLMESRAVVLRCIKYNERSNVVEAFTRQAGLVSFVVAVPRTGRASVKNSLFRPMALLELQWNQRSTSVLGRVRAAKCYAPFVSVPYDPFKSAIALFLAEFLHYAVRGEREGGLLFDYVEYSLLWLDARPRDYANFHLVFLMRLSRFLGFFPNLEGARPGMYFDLLNSCFVYSAPMHGHFVDPADAERLPALMRMGYETMHLFAFSRGERERLLRFINAYYRLHIPSFPVLKSLDVLQQLFAPL